MKLTTSSAAPKAKAKAKPKAKPKAKQRALANAAASEEDEVAKACSTVAGAEKVMKGVLVRYAELQKGYENLKESMSAKPDGRGIQLKLHCISTVVFATYTVNSVSYFIII